MLHYDTNSVLHRGQGAGHIDITPMSLIVILPTGVVVSMYEVLASPVGVSGLWGDPEASEPPFVTMEPSVVRYSDGISSSTAEAQS